ncbi:MAG TPA: acyltransferase family protein [Sedimentisphaerales bacterium]|nr:acyltransferase family protein [Sedimentisphaerales bacterium]
MERARLFFIDNLRILLITLIIMLHLSITYGGAGGWYYRNVPEGYMSLPLTWHNGTVQAFSMGLFFLISGYFTPGSYDRKGPWRFLKDRLLRLGIPLLCYDFIIQPLLAYPLIRVGAQESTGSYFDFLARYYSRFHVGTGPLWFVEALLIFAGFYFLWRLFAKAPASSVQDGGKLPGNLAIAFFALALGAVTFIVRIWLPIGWTFEPLNFQFPFFPQYICMFIVGIVAYRHNWLVRIPDAMGKFWLWLGIIFIIVLFPTIFVLGGALKGDITSFVGGLHWQCLAYALWEQSVCVAMIIGLVVLFRKQFNHQTRLTKTMSASAYTAYIIHAPVTVLVALAIRNITLYPLLKFAFAVFIAVPLCFALGNFIRQLPLAKRIL